MQEGGVSMESRYFIRPEEIPAYSPKNHVGTENRRLVGPGNGAKNLEIVMGILQKGPGALPHVHPENPAQAVRA
jgi:quercetin dioxygenase-like cupin family protein